MTLGRTSAGKIKIKTDGTAGLRAVECACCNPPLCGGCGSFGDLTQATAITMTHVPTGGETVSLNFNMTAPFSSVGYVIEDGNEGVSVSGSSGDCGAGINQFAYGFGRYAALGISRNDDNECVATIQTGGGGGNGGDFSATWQGNITVPIANIFGTHMIPETGESCYATFEFDEVTQETIVINNCYPIEALSSVTIS